MPTTYGNDIVYCLKSHCGVRGHCRQKWVLQVQIICKFETSAKLRLLKNTILGYQQVMSFKVLCYETFVEVL